MEENIENPVVSEETLINMTLNLCEYRLEKSTPESVEHKAMEFYVNKLKSYKPCPEDQKFVKPNCGIRGRTVSAEVTDQMVFQSFVMTDEKGNFKTHKDGSLHIETCGFENFPTYLQHVRGDRHVHPQGSSFYNGITLQNYTLMNCPRYNMSFRNNYKHS